MNNFSEEERLKLIYEALIYCKMVAEMGMPPSCYSKALREPIYFLWEKRIKGNKYSTSNYRSRMAMTVANDSGFLVYDHSIPFNFIQEKLMLLNDPTIGEIRGVLDEYLISCTITSEEDTKLTSLGLRSKMPVDWDGIDKLARYRKAGIEILENK